MQFTKEVDLGEDVGFVKFKVGDKEVELCPSEVLTVISEQAQSPDQAKGMPFIRLVQDFMKQTFGLSSVSAQMADAFYLSLQKSEAQLRDFFGKRLASLFTSGSIPEASGEPGSTPTSPTCPAS